MNKQILSLVLGLVIFSAVNAADRPNNDSKIAARNERAMRNFHKLHKDAANETWYATKEGFKVDFVTNNHKATSVYGKRGSWLYTMESYNIDNLTTDLISLVKTQYDRYYILAVKKIEAPGTDSFFLVNLEGKDSYKTIKLNKTDIELLEDYKKG